MAHETLVLNDLGPGMLLALAALGESGRRILQRWTGRVNEASLPAGVEVDGLASGSWDDGPGGCDSGQFGQERPGTRWLAYGRRGVAFALLRSAGRPARCRVASHRR